MTIGHLLRRPRAYLLHSAVVLDQRHSRKPTEQKPRTICTLDVHNYIVFSPIGCVCWQIVVGRNDVCLHTLNVLRRLCCLCKLAFSRIPVDCPHPALQPTPEWGGGGSIYKSIQVRLTYLVALLCRTILLGNVRGNK